jgi:predicted PurR-regulated permease PerM
VAILEEIHAQIQRYLFVQVAASALLAVLLAVLFSWLHLDNALFWACAGGILHLVPYAGPAVLFGIVGLVSYAQFDQLQPVVLILGGTLAAVGVVGLLLVPWLTQKVGRLNAVMVFVSLLFWGWLWGVWGLLLGVPIVMAINAICERVEDLRPISEFLGYARTKRPDGSGPGTPTD